MALLVAVDGSSAGLDVRDEEASAAAGGDTFKNPTGKHRLYVFNDDTDPIDVTLTTYKEVDGQAVADRVVTVPAESFMVIEALDPDVYNDEDGLVHVAYSAVDDGEDPPVQTAFVTLVRNG